MDGRERNRERVSFRPEEEEEEEGSPCDPIGQRHLMAGGFPEGRGGRERPGPDPASEGSESSQAPTATPAAAAAGAPHESNRKRARPDPHRDAALGCGDGGSGSGGSGGSGSGSSGSGSESHGNESHGNESHGNGSVGGSSGSGKDSALTESSESSNKSSNSHSPSPPSSSTAFSLLSSEQDNPSTSGCSSEQSAKAKTQKELLKTLKELKMHLPSEKRSKGKSSTMNTLKYALRCIRQVKANEEYYQMLMISDSQPPGPDVSSYTIEEINSITSEYTLKNTDIFAVAVSLVTGRVVYISDQAASVLDCRREVFTAAKFVEFLMPQDVGVFYSFTAPYRLPSWSMCTGAESSPTECMQEKSFFCRISGGKEREGALHYYPFRMTPYLMKVQEAQLGEDQLCCLLLAERVHSGYEAPRIPADKRIFTTTHTPNCVFQDVDERAIPLLGYLPQDLIGTPVLLNLHPSDRPLMLAVHRKILQFGGQPFDHSSTRFCAKNGEYVTIDTSWSSFINPWSRKVSFVIGRHKVRTGPVNEDVFAAPAFHGGKIMDSDIQEISEQVHRLLLQPVHHTGSSGYGGGHGGNGPHEQLLSVGSPSDATAAAAAAEEETVRAKPRTFQEICKGVSMLKNQDPQVYPPGPWPPRPEQRPKAAADASSPAALSSPPVRLKDLAPPLVAKDGTAASMEDLPCKDQSVYSYQQISCLDSVIRYLEKCNIPGTAKRKYQFSSHSPSSSDEDRKGSENGSQGPRDRHPGPMTLGARPPGPLSTKGPKKPLVAPLPLPRKAESVASLTSQCSYSSTIVHVGDKKLQPESELIEDMVESPAPAPPPPPPASAAPPPPPSQEKEAYRRLGLTRQVLAAHTQKEEQAFLVRCRQLRDARTFQKDCSTYLHRHRHSTHAEESSGPRGGPHKPGAAGRPEPAASARKQPGGRNRKSKKPRLLKRPDSSDSGAASDRRPRPRLQGLNPTSWSPSEASQSAFSAVSYPGGALVPGFPLSAVYPPSAPTPACPDAATPLSGGGFGGELHQGGRSPPTAAPFAAPLVAPLVAPVVTLVLPNYLFPPMGPLGPLAAAAAAAAALGPAFFPEPTQAPPPYHHQPAYPMQPQPQPPYGPLPAFLPPAPPQQPAFLPPQPAFQAPQTSYGPQQHFALGPPQASFGVRTQFLAPGPYPAPPFAYAMPPAGEPPKDPDPRDHRHRPRPRDGAGAAAAASRSSTPASAGPGPDRDRDPPPAAAAASPPLFGSRCSSPLQLNLLSMEERPHPPAAPPPPPPPARPAAPAAGGEMGGATAEVQEEQEQEEQEEEEEEESPEDGAQSDGNLTSSDLLDLLLLEDSHCGTGSATSGSLGSRSGSRSGLGSGSGSRGSGSRGSGSRGSRSGLGSRGSGSRGSGFGSKDCRTSASRAPGSRTGSRNTSRYFGSVDSPGPGPRARARARGGLEAPAPGAPALGAPAPGAPAEGLARYRLQEPLWLLGANTDDQVMMTYQMPSRDIQKVLREDKERLRLMQKDQPCFSSEQRRELVEERPWMRRGGLPSNINVKECVYCEDAATHPSAEEDHPGMDLGDRGEEGSRRDQIQPPQEAGPQRDLGS